MICRSGDGHLVGATGDVGGFDGIGGVIVLIMLAHKIRTIREEGRRHIVIFQQIADIGVKRAA